VNPPACAIVTVGPSELALAVRMLTLGLSSKHMLPSMVAGGGDRGARPPQFRRRRPCCARNTGALLVRYMRYIGRPDGRAAAGVRPLRETPMCFSRNVCNVWAADRSGVAHQVGDKTTSDACTRPPQACPTAPNLASAPMVATKPRRVARGNHGNHGNHDAHGRRAAPAGGSIRPSDRTPLAIFNPRHQGPDPNEHFQGLLPPRASSLAPDPTHRPQNAHRSG
jgi:hypothetical protein